MADDVQALVLQVSADVRTLQRQMTQAQRIVDQSMRSAEGSAQRAARNIERSFATINIRGVIGGGLNDGLSGLTSQAGGLGAALGRLGPAGIGAGAALGALALAANRAREAMTWADDLGDTADRLGVTAEQLQVMEQSLEHFGGSAEEGRSAIQRLNQAIGAMRTGVGAARAEAAFGALGITANDLRNVQNAADLLPLLADRIQRLGNAADQAAIARRLGIEPLLPLLRQGSEGVRQYEERLRSMGAVVSNQTVGSLNDLAERTREADVRMQAATRTLSASLAPALASLSDVAAGAITQIASLVGWLTHFDSLDGRTQAAINVAVQSRRRATAFRTGSYLEAVGAGMPGLGGARARAIGAAQNDAAAGRAAAQVGLLALDQALAAVPAPPPTVAGPSRVASGGGGRSRGRGGGGRTSRGGGGARSTDNGLIVIPPIMADRSDMVDLNRPFESREIQTIVETGFRDAAGELAASLQEHADETRRVIENTIEGGINAAIRGGWPGLLEWMGQQLMQTLAQSAAQGLAGVFSPKGGIGGNIFSSIASWFIGHNAEGTSNWRGGPTWVGERGPEIVNLPRGAQVIPAGLSAAMARGTAAGRAVVQPIFNDFSGAVVTEDLMRAANASARAAAARAGQAAYAQAMRDAPGVISRRRQEGRL